MSKIKVLLCHGCNTIQRIILEKITTNLYSGECPRCGDTGYVDDYEVE